MSEREKKLLSLFAVAGVILLGFWGYSTYRSYKASFTDKLNTAEQQLDEAEMYEKSRAVIEDDIQWLAEHEPKPRDSGTAGSDMEKIVSTEAARYGITVTSQKILELVEALAQTPPRIYSVAQVEYKVTCSEQNLYRWLGSIHDPKLFRIVSSIVLVPNRDKEELIDATAVFDLWFIAKSADAEPTDTEATP